MQSSYWNAQPFTAGRGNPWKNTHFRAFFRPNGPFPAIYKTETIEMYSCRLEASKSIDIL
jgi:hypothetical protein